MAKKITALFRRKRESKTDYKKRLSLLISGQRRLVVRKSNKNVVAQLVEYLPDGDKVVASASSSELKKRGWTMSTSNLPAAYLVGLLLGKRAVAKKHKSAILDLGLQSPKRGTRPFAVLKGALDAGMDIPHSEDVLPSEDRLSGGHIAKYASAIASDKDRYTRQFSAYLKNKSKPEDIKKLFETMKQKLSA